MDVGAGNPRLVDFELESGLAAVQMDGQVQRQRESQQRNNQGEDSNVGSRRGSNMSSNAPASGTKVTSVRM